MRKCLQIKITSKNNSARQWDNGVSRLKVCVHRYTQVYRQSCCCACARSVSFSCAHINRAADVCHLSAQHRHVSELYFEQWFSDVLAYRRIKSWHVTGFEATVTLLATAQCQGPKLLSGRGPCYLPFNKKKRKEKKKYVARLSLKLSLSKHITLTALTYSVQCLPWLSCQLVNLPFSHSKKQKTKQLIRHSALCKLKHLFKQLSGDVIATWHRAYPSAASLS